MPYYQFDVCFDLTDAERQALVDRVNAIHTQRFHTATFIVNVGFMQHGREDKLRIFRAGKPHVGNSIHGWLRRGDRTAASFNDTVLDLVHAWTEIVNKGQTEGVPRERQLSGAFIEASMDAAWEHGFLVCEGGKDAAWLEGNRKAFEALAEKGDEDFKYTLHEMDTRADLKA